MSLHSTVRIQSSKPSLPHASLFQHSLVPKRRLIPRGRPYSLKQRLCNSHSHWLVAETETRCVTLLPSPAQMPVLLGLACTPLIWVEPESIPNLLERKPVSPTGPLCRGHTFSWLCRPRPCRIKKGDHLTHNLRGCARQHQRRQKSLCDGDDFKG